MAKRTHSLSAAQYKDWIREKRKVEGMILEDLLPDLHSKKWLGLCALIFAIVAPATEEIGIVEGG